ncbi:PEGA domain-containing protein [Salinibacter ruber]|uniref:PEGA domain-containing protein n=1 Tax=Salinibacter ruber TaxID=146919 RepID=UPI00216846A6
MAPQPTADRATVALDGEEVGATPATLTEVTTGTYEVTFSRPGHKTVTRRVDVSATDTATVTATLKRRTGHLRVLVRPWGSIYIDDQRRAENSDVWYDTTLPAGPHTITARHPALGEKSRPVTVAPQDTQSVVVDLREQ